MCSAQVSINFKRLFSACLLMFTMLHLSVSAQTKSNDTLRLPRWLRLDVEGGFYYADAPNNTVSLPGILSERRPNQSTIRGNWNLAGNGVTDNPIYHGAGFTVIDADFRLSRSFDIMTSLTGELRGTSYGVYNTQNIIVFSQFRFNYHDTFKVCKKALAVSASVGNFNNIRTDEGLAFYNIDAEALDIKASYAGFTFEHMHIADLVQSIGLNIDDALVHNLYYETPADRHKGRWKIGVGYTINNLVYLPDGADPYRNMQDASAAYIKDSSIRIYVQGSHLENTPWQLQNDYAAVAGIKKEWHKGRFNIAATLEGRYYGSEYKYRMNNNNVYYRNLTSGPNTITYPWYANSIGPNLYPLRNTERPFSQLAFFTQPQFSAYNTSALILYTDARIRLWKQLYFRGLFDINFVHWELPYEGIPSHAGSFVYPFCTAGLYYAPAKNVMIFGGITNKMMNLDNTFQTFYLLQQPCLYLQVVKTVEGMGMGMGS